ncbi:unnamed protein product [Trichobilharzia regenti]|nr:unnamed protein product [Trichobilharzia regenti]
MTHHPDVRAISFTGSTEVGQLIMKAAATNIKHVKLELGGKSPLIIFADADIDKAAEIAHEATMVNHGQCCVAGTRIFVQAPIYDQMIERLKKLAENRKVGDPFSSDTIQGPQFIYYSISPNLFHGLPPRLLRTKHRGNRNSSEQAKSALCSKEI